MHQFMVSEQGGFWFASALSYDGILNTPGSGVSKLHQLLKLMNWNVTFCRVGKLLFNYLLVFQSSIHYDVKFLCCFVSKEMVRISDFFDKMCISSFE